MAKQQPAETSSQRDEVRSLAERLYERNWRPDGMGTEPTAFAAMCFRGAQHFLRVASRISEGQSPEEIINSPQPAATE